MNSVPCLPEKEGVSFKIIPGYQFYVAGDDGSIFSCLEKGRWKNIRTTWRKLKPAINQGRTNHLIVYLGGEKLYVHRIILTTFTGPCPEGMQACHNDDNSFNNSIKNLRWDTYQHNVDDKRKNGRLPIGEKSGASKVTEKDVLEIRSLHSSGKSQGEIARTFGISQSNVFQIVRRNTWKHI